MVKTCPKHKNKRSKGQIGQERYQGPHRGGGKRDSLQDKKNLLEPSDQYA